MNKNLKKITTTLSFLVIVFLVANISNVVSWGFDPGYPQPDTIRPTVSITSPSNGATVSGVFTIRASASDNVGVYRVYFYIDGVYIDYDSTASYTKSANTANYINGLHSIRATAVDAAGNMRSDTHSVTFYTPPPPDTTNPTVDIVSPDVTYYPEWIEVNGDITIKANADDNVAVNYVQFYIKDSDTHEVVADLGRFYTAPYETIFDTTTLANDIYELQAKAVDTSGNYRNDYGYFIVFNTPDVIDARLTYSHTFYTTYDCRDPGGFEYEAWIQIDMTAVVEFSYASGVGYEFTYSEVTYETSWDELMLSPQKCDPVISNRIDWPFQISFNPGEDGFGCYGPYTHSKDWVETESATWPDGGPYSRVVLGFIVAGNNIYIEYETTIFFVSPSGTLNITDEISEFPWDI